MHFVTVFFILASSFLLKAQQPAYFHFADQQFEGIDIYDVIQDKNYDYWFATDDGLYKHDGYKYEKIENNEMKSISLFNFVMDKKGNIYCHNLNQQVFQIKDGKCKEIFKIPDSGNDISLTITPSHQLIISSGLNVYILDENLSPVSKSNFSKIYLSQPLTLPNSNTIIHLSSLNEIVEINSKGNIHKIPIFINGEMSSSIIGALRFFIIENSVYAINMNDKSLYRVNYYEMKLTFIGKLKLNNGHDHIRIYSLKDEIWIAGSLGGVKRIITEGDLFNDNNFYFENEFISDIYIDKEDNILLSTFDKGVLVIPNLKIKDIDSKLAGYNINRISPAIDGSLLLGTNSGEILKYNGNVELLSNSGGKAIETLIQPDNLPYIFSDSYGFMITNLLSKTQFASKLGSLKDVVSLGNNTYLLAMNMGVLELIMNSDRTKIIQLKQLYKGRTYSIEREPGTGIIYLSSINGLLYKTPNGEFKPVHLNNSDIIATCIQSSINKTYVSTRKNGLLLLKNGKVIKRILPELNGNTLIFSSFIIYKDQILANTQKGFLVLSKEGQVVAMLNKANGLSTNKIIDFCVNNDELWIVHSLGIQHFSLSSFNGKMPKPKLWIRSVFVNNKILSKQKLNNTFTSAQRKFRFVLQVPTLRQRENIIYHYKLEGFEEEWHSQPYSSNEITFNALGYGSYRLIVKAENNGVYSDPDYFGFTIAAPFYFRWWFLTGLILVFLSVVYLTYQKQLSIQQRKAQHINELNASRLTAIQSQMNPHFIFNSLNSIQDLVLKGDIDNSYTFITKFSNLVRRTLNYSDKDFIHFEQEIKLIELYLSLEKLRFKDDLDYILDYNDIEDILIPPMLIQPFIENALVHGLLHKNGLKKLRISFQMNNEILICKIEDNGVGRKRAKEIKERQRTGHESFAVAAIKKRFSILQEHYGEKLGFTYTDLEQGTLVTLIIPFQHKF